MRNKTYNAFCATCHLNKRTNPCTIKSVEKPPEWTFDKRGRPICTGYRTWDEAKKERAVVEHGRLF